MILDKKMCKVFSRLEYLIGMECYNPNSYDGYTHEEGRDYRYPVHIPDKEGTLVKTSGYINNLEWENVELTPKAVKAMKYKFGSNHLLIGLGIMHVLEELEERYGIDFNELEDRLSEEE